MDVKFSVQLNKADRATLSFVNKTSSQRLLVIAVLSGRLLNEDTVIDENCKLIEGYIDIFPGEKMNQSLEQYASVEIECTALVERNGETTTEKASSIFYNEGKSLDADIVPFDLVIHNKHVALSDAAPLSMSLVSDQEKKYEICIKSRNGQQSCVFEVIARKGRTDFDLPSEVLYAELEMGRNFSDRYNFFYTKFEGMDTKGFLNRQLVSMGLSISFDGNVFGLQPQGRLGPDGTDLSDEFVLSDEYFVHTYKDYSSFGRRMENIIAVCNFPRFFHESQDANENRPQSKRIRTPVRRNDNFDVRTNRVFRYVNSNNEERQFYEQVAGKMISHSQGTQSTRKPAPAKSGGCSGCQRKRANANIA